MPRMLHRPHEIVPFRVSADEARLLLNSVGEHINHLEKSNEQELHRHSATAAVIRKTNTATLAKLRDLSGKLNQQFNENPSTPNRALEITDAPAHLNAEEATAWVAGFNSATGLS
jgi:hypothetical protein